MSKELFDGLDELILTDVNQEITVDPKAEEKEIVVKDVKTTSTDELNEDGTKKTKSTTTPDNTIDLTEATKKVDDEGNPIDENTNTTTTSQEEVLKAWAEEFKENKILSEDDLKEFDGSFESLSKAFNAREVRTGLEMVDDYKSQLPAELKFLAENWEEGVPLDELINIRSNQMRYSGIQEKELEEKPETQKAVVAEYLRKTTKFSETKISKEIDRLIDSDELGSEAKDSLKELKVFEANAEDILKKETKKQQEKRRDENAETIKQYNKTADSIKEVIPGIKITEKDAQDMLKKTIDPIGVDGYGNPVSYIQSLRNENPYEFDLKLNYIMTVTKGLTDFSKINNTVKTAVTKDLFNKLDNPKLKNGKDGNTGSGEKRSVLDWLDMPQNRKK